MAGSMTNYLEAKLLDHTLGVASFAMPSTIFVALHTESPGEFGTGIEVTGGPSPGYARQPTVFASAVQGAPSSCKNATAGVFQNLPATVVTHVGLWDSLTGGNLLYYTELTSARTAASGDSFNFEIDSLEVRMA